MTMTAPQVVDFVHEAVIARAGGRDRHVLGMIEGLLAGPSAGNAWRVVTGMAGAAGESLPPEPGGQFVAYRPRTIGEDGHVRNCSADELEPCERCFGRIAVAMANRDPDMARDLFLGYVAGSRGNAAQLLAVGVNRVAHLVTCPACCPAGLRGWLR
jgi:hypothetical protein